MKKYCKIVVLFSFVILCFQNVFAGNWIQNGEGWFYEDNGEYITNQQKKIDGCWYYFGEDGSMLTGYNKIGEKFYVFKQDGTPKTDLINFNGKTYNVDGKGNIKGINEAEFEQLIENDFVINSGNNAVITVIEHAKSLLPLYSSKYSLRLKLEREGITTDLIDYAIYNAGVNWKEQAVKTAQFWLKTLNLDRELLKFVLECEKFTDAEVNYGVDIAFDDGKIAEYRKNQIVAKENISNTISAYYNALLASNK